MRHADGRQVGPEVIWKLEQSKEAVRHKELRTIRCPDCGFRLLDVYGKDHCYVRVKCRKCKFSDTIDTALFRTVRRRGEERR